MNSDKFQTETDALDDPITLSNSDALFFDYLDGYLDVEFTKAMTGDIFFEFHLKGDSVIRTPGRFEPFELGASEFDIAEDSVLKASASSSMCKFCYEMVRWLEAVVCNVYQCSFSWDAEGPEGSLSWSRYGDGGTLKLSWSGSNYAPAFDRTVRLNKERMVHSFYRSFRNFVESDRYNPKEYEPDEWFGDKLIEIRSPLVEKRLAARKQPDVEDVQK